MLTSGMEFMEMESAHEEALPLLEFSELATPCNNCSNNGDEDFDGWVCEMEDITSGNKQLPLEKKKTKKKRETCKIGFMVYWKYISTAYRGALVPLILLAQVLFKILQISSNYWMARASPASQEVKPHVNGSTLLYVLVALSLGSSLCIIVQALLLVTVGFRTETLLFKNMLNCIFHAPVSFFDSTLTGYILNRVNRFHT